MASNRIPSVPDLERNPSNKAAILAAWHRDLTAEIEGLTSGYMKASGETKASALRKSKQRLTRLVRNADSVGVALT
jgi:hypothetical protein